MGFLLYNLWNVDWLHPDNIILENSENTISYQEFTKHMQSLDFQNLRLLTFNNGNFIRYEFDDDLFWYTALILQIKNKDYYIDIYLLSNGEDKQLEKAYISFNREEKLKQLLK